MKILIYIKEVPDIRVSLIGEAGTGEVREAWSVPVMEPADRYAIDAALSLKKTVPGTRITAIHLGPGDGPVREAMALGCDEGFRVWEAGLDSIHAAAKSIIFARAARICSFDLILTGCRSQDTGSGQVGILLASELGVPWAGSVAACEGVKAGKLTLVRLLSGGYRERVESSLPVVASMEPLGESDRYATLPEVMQAGEASVESWDLADIGLSGAVIREADSGLVFGPLRQPLLKLRYAEAPDSSLPAHQRIRKLIEGTVSRREGRVVTGEADEVARAIVESLADEGWLDHLGGDRRGK